jgi:prepilin-type processing-associated H-X9-DG protein
MARIVAPATKVFLTHNATIYANMWQGYEDVLATSLNSTDAFTKYLAQQDFIHNESTNILFCDGHVKSYNVNTYRTITCKGAFPCGYWNLDVDVA